MLKPQAHATLSPSSAARWMACPGSVPFNIGPRTSNDYADEGTAAHTVASACLLNEWDAEEFIGNTIIVKNDDTGTQREYPWTEELAEGLQPYLNWARDEHKAVGGIMRVEQRLDLSEVLGSNQFGTSDLQIVSLKQRYLVSADLKFGQGKKVYAKDNYQLILYALGSLRGMRDKFDKVKVVVVQPRLEHIDEFEYTIQEMNVFEEMLRQGAEATLGLTQEKVLASPRVYLRPGDEQCQWCAFEARCPRRAEQVAAEVFDDFEVITDDSTPVEEVLVQAREPAMLSDKLLARSYALSDGILRYCSKVRAELESRVMQGASIVGPDGKSFKTVEGKKGNRYWKDAKAAEGVLTGLLPPDKAYVPRTIITPSVAGKLLDKKRTAKQWEQLTPLIGQPPGQPSVVLGSDPRPAWTSAADVSEFDVVSELEE